MIRAYGFCTLALLVGLGAIAQETDATASEKVRESLKLYEKAWNNHDAAARTKLLNSCFAKDGTYTDPTFHAASPADLSEHIGGFLSSAEPGKLSIVIVSAVDIHHQSFRFLWEAQDGEGNPIATGIDYGEFGSEGKIRKIVGFFGPIANKE
jgi:hypothetical protein